MSLKNRPTIKTREALTVAQEVEALRKAMKGVGTDEAAIISVLTSCSSSQRQDILKQYERTFDRELTKDLKKELSGNFEDVILALMTPSSEFLARELKHALNQKDSEVIVEILYTCEPQGLRAIKEEYERQNDDSLADDLDDETKGVFEDVLIATVTGERSDEFSDEVSETVARAIYNDDHGVNSEEVVKAFSSLSYKQLRAVFLEYYKLAGRTMGEAFGLEYKDKEKINMQILFKSLQNRYGFLAETLHKSLAGPGTKDRDLIRLVVSRSEVDLGNVKDEYNKMYDRALETDVKGDTSGDYKKVLLALLQNNY